MSKIVLLRLLSEPGPSSAGATNIYYRDVNPSTLHTIQSSPRPAVGAMHLGAEIANRAGISGQKSQVKRCGVYISHTFLGQSLSTLTTYVTPTVTSMPGQLPFNTVTLVPTTVTPSVPRTTDIVIQTVTAPDAGGSSVAGSSTVPSLTTGLSAPSSNSSSGIMSGQFTGSGSGGKIASVTVGGVAGVSIIGALAWCFYRRNRRRKFNYYTEPHRCVTVDATRGGITRSLTT